MQQNKLTTKFVVTYKSNNKHLFPIEISHPFLICVGLVILSDQKTTNTNK